MDQELQTAMLLQIGGHTTLQIQNHGIMEAWTEVNDLNTARYNLAGAGARILQNALAMGGGGTNSCLQL